MDIILLIIVVLVIVIIIVFRNKKKTESSANTSITSPSIIENRISSNDRVREKTDEFVTPDNRPEVASQRVADTVMDANTENQPLRVGCVLQGGKYRIIRLLGQGGFGITYLAEQVLMERKVCIKEFFLKDHCGRVASTSQVSLGTTSNRAMMEKYQQKFLKEARMIARLDHPNIVRIHDVFEENNTAYYVMDYIEGKNLNNLVKERGALPEAEAISYIHQVGEGLAYVHEKGINHLDIKPGNIMLRSDGRPVLIDFGMSKQYDNSGEQTSTTPIGVSEGYAPLEMYQAGGVSDFSPRTDIYELGATLFYLVTGSVPPSASIILNDGLMDIPNSISVTTRTAIKLAMDPIKKNRPESVRLFLRLLSPIEDKEDNTVLL